jgi:hypothetical protein
MLARARAFVLRNKVYCVYIPLFWLVFIGLTYLFAKRGEILPFIYRAI